MGSFDSTCAISGLSLHVGDPVRFFLLTENPYADDGVCYIDDRWVVRTVPIKAVYNDYGSIEEYSEGIVERKILEAFEDDLIEVGTGDNRVHDCPVRLSMSFSEMLNALQEGRVRVGTEGRARRAQREKAQEHFKDYERPIYEPTFQNVEKVLLAAAPTVDRSKYLIDDGKEGGWVRVRVAGYGEEKSSLLEEAQAVLSTTYSVVITAGSGDYANERELRCFLAPGLRTDGHHRRDYSFNRDRSDEASSKSRLVKYAMVREDVWQAIIGLKIPTSALFRADRAQTVDDYRAGVRKYFVFLRKLKAKYEARIAQLEDGSTQKYLMEEEMRRALREPRYSYLDDDQDDGDEDPEDLPGASVLTERFSRGLGRSWSNHLHLCIEAGLDSDDEFINVLGEFSFITDYLTFVRHLWRPSDNAGPQFGEHDMHYKYFKALTEVSKQIKKADQEKRKNW